MSSHRVVLHFTDDAHYAKIVSAANAAGVTVEEYCKKASYQIATFVVADGGHA